MILTMTVLVTSMDRGRQVPVERAVTAELERKKLGNELRREEDDGRGDFCGPSGGPNAG